mmetsp:Transcript_12883/g.40473  ORF Transcript_12883/g.40473 Transcript_12883/m.40473 type:complete len:208 (+) Transcript_12883:1638-2261(+)
MGLQELLPDLLEDLAKTARWRPALGCEKRAADLAAKGNRRGAVSQSRSPDPYLRRVDREVQREPHLKRDAPPRRVEEPLCQLLKALLKPRAGRELHVHSPLQEAFLHWLAPKQPGQLPAGHHPPHLTQLRKEPLEIQRGLRLLPRRSRGAPALLLGPGRGRRVEALCGPRGEPRWRLQLTGAVEEADEPLVLHRLAAWLCESVQQGP